MNTILVMVFSLTYLAIVSEHFLKISKSASALLGAGILWSLYAVMAADSTGVTQELTTLEHTHILSNLSEWMNQMIHRQEVVVLLIGLASAIVDNVPLVAASMSMYEKAIYPTDSFFWQFLAYCAGTGGSILVIGSAAGIAAMGIAKINFAWYLRKISGLALLGYLAGASVFLIRAA